MDATKREILEKLLDKIAEEQKYGNGKVDIHDVNSGGTNMTATLFLVTLSAEGKEDLKLFAKVATMGEAMRHTTPTACPFTTELYFYKTLLNKYEALQERHSIPEEHRLSFPKIYGSHDEYLNEVVVLENLIEQSYETADRQQSIGLEYATKAMEVLAKFHALSFAYKEEDPEEYEAVLKKLTFIYPTAVLNGLEAMRPKMLAGAYAVIDEEYKEKLKKFLEDGPDPFAKFLSALNSTEPGVIMHGDFKTSNLMHRKRNGKLELLELLPVDFQIVRNGSPVFDLMYFFFTAVDEHFRREHYHELLDLYYEQLKLALGRLNVDSEKAYSEKTYKEELKELEMLGLMIGVILLPMILVAEENMPAFGGEADFKDFMVKGSDLYKERFNGIVKSYVDWGLL